jgi:YHS domain-containing protein
MDTLTDSLDEFDTAIYARIAAAAKAPNWTSAIREGYMGEMGKRLQRYDEVARHMIADLVRPRMLRLASHFSTARSDRMPHSDHSVLWFGYCERFPANVKLEFTTEHDERVEHLCVRYELAIAPSFLKFKAHDNLTLPLEAIDDDAITQWVERRMLEFVETYLQIDRGSTESDEEVVTDPVCAMRFKRTDATAQANYRGHSYFFCSEDCHRRFAADPNYYILFRTNG